MLAATSSSVERIYLEELEDREKSQAAVISCACVAVCWPTGRSKQLDAHDPKHPAA